MEINSEQRVSIGYRKWVCCLKNYQKLAIPENVSTREHNH